MSHDSQHAAAVTAAEPAHPEEAPSHAHGTLDLAPTATFGLPRRRVALPGGLTVATVDEGQGPAVLFLHGLPTSSALWRKVIPALGGVYRCVAPDLLGFGETECPPGAPLGLQAQADLVLALLDALELEEVAVVGHDIGGGVAQMLAADHPGRVLSLALIDAIAFDHELPWEVRMLAGLARCSPVFDLVCETGLLPAFARSRFGLARGAHARGAIDPGLVEDSLAPLYRDAPPAYRASRERFRNALTQLVAAAPSPVREASEKLGTFEKPTMVIWGLEDPYIPVSLGRRLADTIPGCERFEGLAYVGHWVPEEAPDQLATLLLEHLA